MSVGMGDVQAHLAFWRRIPVACAGGLWDVYIALSYQGNYPCIIRASEGIAFLRSGKLGFVLLVVAKGILLLLARNSC